MQPAPAAAERRATCARLTGTVAVVTGAASGLGRAVTRRFVDEGACVVAVDLPGSPLDDVAQLLGSRVVSVAGDVREIETHERAVAAAIKAFDRLDVYVGNAGIFDGHTPLAAIPTDRLRAAAEEMLAVNVVAYLLGAAVARPALERTRGSMIFTASPAGLHDVGGGILYTVSKHAVVGIVRRLAFEFAPHVRVNGVAPGATATNLRGPAALGLDESVLSGGRARLEQVTATGAPAPIGLDPAHYASTYVHLASRDDSGVITGQIVEAVAPDGLAGMYASVARR